MLMPKRVKEGRRKMMRGRMKGKATQGNQISFGEFGIVALEPGWITSRQIEAARISMTRKIKRGGKVWIRIFPHKSYTKKPLETRMGKGKASVEGWVAVIKPGRVMFEMSGVAEELAKEAMRLAIFKLPIKCKFYNKADLMKSLIAENNGHFFATDEVAEVEVVEVTGDDSVEETAEAIGGGTANEPVATGEATEGATE